MYVVIFRARLQQLDSDYLETARSLRELALRDYACQEFVACSEGEQEIAVSYWNSLEDVEAWKEAAEHRLAQRQGVQVWYRDFQIEVAEVVRSHRWSREAGVSNNLPDAPGS